MILKLTGKKLTHCYFRRFDNFRYLSKYYVPIFGVNCFTKIFFFSKTLYHTVTLLRMKILQMTN